MMHHHPFIAAIWCLLGVFSTELHAETTSPFTASAPRMITSSADHDDYWPCFSADGTKVFFSRRSGDGPWLLYQTSVDGGEATAVFEQPPSPSATRITRSPAGRLAFVGQRGIWITNPGLRGAERLRLKGLTGNASYPSWYPDEKHLLLVAYQPNAGGTLYRIDIRSGETIALTDPAKIRAGMPSVSPDGKSIVFAGQRNRGGSYDQDENSIWNLTDGHEPEQLVDHQGRAPTWSPSGRWIAYESKHGGPDQRQAVFITSPDGKTDQRITAFELNANHPVWSPDGKSLAVSVVGEDHSKRRRIAIITLRIAGDHRPDE